MPNLPLNIAELLLVVRVPCEKHRARENVACMPVQNNDPDGPPLLPGVCVGRIRRALGPERWT